MRGGYPSQGRMRMGGFGDTSAAPAGAVPVNVGGNAVQGKGIVFTYQTPTVTSVAHGASSGSQIIQFDNNSTFLWLRSTFSADIAGAAFLNDTVPCPLITVTIADTGNGMQFMNAPIPVFEIAGISPGLPYILPTPQLIQPNASYAFNFANYDASVAYANLRFQMHGFRIFSTGITDLSQLRGML